MREHQFLAATANIGYTFERVRGVANLLFGGTGFFIDKFHLDQGEGVLWLHGYGNVFEKSLAAGESIDIEPGGWLYKDPQVRMETVMQRHGDRHPRRHQPGDEPVHRPGPDRAAVDVSPPAQRSLNAVPRSVPSSSRAAGGVMLRRAVSPGSLDRGRRCWPASAIHSAAQGADPSLAAPGRDPAQPIDTGYTRKILEYTTEPFFLSPLVDYLPASKTVPTPAAVLGDIAGTPTDLPYSKEVYAYMRLLAKATPRVRVFSIGTTEEGREMIAVAVASEALMARLDANNADLARAGRSAHHQLQRLAGATRSPPARRRSTTSPARSTPPRPARRPR